MGLIRNLEDIKKYKTLVNALTLRYLASRYRGSILGFFWTFLNPLFLMLIYTVVFKYYMRFDDVDNYTIFLFVGLLQWIWTSSALIETSTSITSSANFITKSMFPPHILPTVASLTALINFLLSLPLLFIFMIFFKVPFYSTILYLPIVIFIQFIFLYALGLILSIMNVYLRDTQHLLGNILNFLFFLSPILYPIDKVPEKFLWTLKVNPFASFTSTYHRLILDGKLPESNLVYMMVGVTLLTLIISMYVYDKHKEQVVDLL